MYNQSMASSSSSLAPATERSLSCLRSATEAHAGESHGLRRLPVTRPGGTSRGGCLLQSSQTLLLPWEAWPGRLSRKSGAVRSRVLLSAQLLLLFPPLLLLPLQSPACVPLLLPATADGGVMALAAQAPIAQPASRAPGLKLMASPSSFVAPATEQCSSGVAAATEHSEGLLPCTGGLKPVPIAHSAPRALGSGAILAQVGRTARPLPPAAPACRPPISPAAATGASQPECKAGPTSRKTATPGQH